MISRSLRRAAVCVLLGISAASAASATTVTVLMTGTLTAVDDSNSVTDGSLTFGVPYSLTLSYDDTVSDSDSDPLFGTYLVPAATASYGVVVGNYRFESGGILNVGLLDGFFDPSEDTLSWFADQFTNSGVLDPGVSFAPFGYSNIALYDYTGTALSSDDLTDANWDRSHYASDNQAFYLFLEVLDPRTAGQDYVELVGTIDLMTVLPEPSTIWLLALGSFALVRRRQR
jgi:hypothetical protein